MTARKEEKRETKRDLILQAAFRLFTTNGFSDTKMIDIAREANMGKGTIYEYFSGKDQLFEMLFQQKVMTPYNGIQAVLEQKATARERLAAYVEFESQFSESIRISREVLYKLMMDFSWTDASPAQVCIKKLMDYRLQLLYTIIDEGIRNGEFAPRQPMMATMTAMGSMAAYQAFNSGILRDKNLECYKEEEPWKTDDFLDLLLSGLQAEVLPGKTLPGETSSKCVQTA